MLTGEGFLQVPEAPRPQEFELGPLLCWLPHALLSWPSTNAAAVFWLYVWRHHVLFAMQTWMSCQAVRESIPVTQREEG